MLIRATVSSGGPLYAPGTVELVGAKPLSRVVVTLYVPSSRTWARIDGKPSLVNLDENACDLSVTQSPARAFLGASPEIATRCPGLASCGRAVTELYGYTVTQVV